MSRAVNDLFVLREMLRLLLSNPHRMPRTAGKAMLRHQDVLERTPRERVTAIGLRVTHELRSRRHTDKW